MSPESEAERDRRYAREDHERYIERQRADETAHRQAMERMQMMNMSQHTANTQAQANVAQVGMTAMGTSHQSTFVSAPAPVVMAAPAPAPMVVPAPAYVPTVRYCGPISWLIGIFIFPCICCCPVDQMPMYAPPVAPAPVYMQPQPPIQYQQQPMQYAMAPMQGMPAEKPVY